MLVLSKLVYTLLFVTNLFMNAQSFNMCIYPTMQDNCDKLPQSSSSSYLDKINNMNNHKIKKLEGIRKNITNYIKEFKDDPNKKKLEKGFVSTYMPIPKAHFDTIFLNIYIISVIYMSYNSDRIIFELSSGKRYVYYINNKQDAEKINKLINLIPNPIKHIIINDVQNTMDDMFGHLYCEPK